ncbi:hypothetical protein RJ641_013980, partial [Dillenia turbinata]
MQTYFDAPEGTSPVALNLSSMGKGMAWINGHSLDRYWMSYPSPLCKPTQSDFIPDYTPPPISSWRRMKDKFETMAAELKPQARLNCPSGKVIAHVQFADYGDPFGVCGTYVPGKGPAPHTKEVDEQ